MRIVRSFVEQIGGELRIGRATRTKARDLRRCFPDLRYTPRAATGKTIAEAIGDNSMSLGLILVIILIIFLLGGFSGRFGGYGYGYGHGGIGVIGIILIILIVLCSHGSALI